MARNPIETTNADRVRHSLTCVTAFVRMWMNYGVPPLPDEPMSTPRPYRVVGLKDDGSRVSVTGAVTDEGARVIEKFFRDDERFHSISIEPFAELIRHKPTQRQFPGMVD